jgi:hypothetical protein
MDAVKNFWVSLKSYFYFGIIDDRMNRNCWFDFLFNIVRQSMLYEN